MHVKEHEINYLVNNDNMIEQHGTPNGKPH